jgi:hypothetical protein
MKSLFLVLLLTGCSSGWVVKTHPGFMVPTTYELTDGTTSINYYNGNCCCVAKPVLEYIKTEIESGLIDTKQLAASPTYRDSILATTCKLIQGQNASY